MAFEDRTRMLHQNVYTYVPDYSVLTQKALWIFTTLNTSNPVPKNIKKTEVWMEMSYWDNLITDEQFVFYRRGI